MKKIDLDGKDPLSDWIRELGAERPSVDFQMNILKKLATQSTINSYQPVISLFGMKIIGFLIAAFFGAVLLFVPASESSLSFWNQLPELTLPSVNFPLPTLIMPNIELGAVFNISIIIFSLMAFCVSLLASRHWRYQ